MEQHPVVYCSDNLGGYGLPPVSYEVDHPQAMPQGHVVDDGGDMDWQREMDRFQGSIVQVCPRWSTHIYDRQTGLDDPPPPGHDQE